MVRMLRRKVTWTLFRGLAALLLVGCTTAVLMSADPQPGPAGPKGGARPTREKGKDEDSHPLPTDPKLVNIYLDFVKKTEALAADYEKAKENEKAMVCYDEILRLVPDYAPAKQKKAHLVEEEYTAEHKVVEVQANKDWQDTGVQLIAGKPVRLLATGSWTFNMSHKVGPGGMELPKQLRDFNLGSLIGVIVTGNSAKDASDVKPFLVGDHLEFNAPSSGRLLLRMYDTDPSDNVGKIAVQIMGTFERTGK